MKLIKLNVSKHPKNNKKMSLFECPRCGNHEERITCDGKKQVNCCGGVSRIAPKGSPLHNRYVGITQRCWDKNAINYDNYGGRGITICKAWHNFDNFAIWALNNGFSLELEIDRIDNDKGYSPDNCHFVERKYNQRNKRNNIHTQEDIDMIRELYSKGNITQKKLSIMFNDSYGNISNIINYRTWA